MIKPVSFKISNVRLVKDLSIEFPEKGIVVVKGKNEKGKTTAIESFRDMVTANNTTKLSDGVPNGFTEGEFVLPSGEVVLVKQDLSFSKSGSRFIVVDADGNVKKKVSDVKDLFQYNDVTIEDFLAWGLYTEGRRKQRDLFLKVLGEDIEKEFLRLEREEKLVYEERTEVNGREFTLRQIAEKNKPSQSEIDLASKEEEILSQYKEAEKTHLEACVTLETNMATKRTYEERKGKLEAKNKEYEDKLGLYQSTDRRYKKEIDDLEAKLNEKRIEKDKELLRIKEEGLVIKRELDGFRLDLAQTEAIDVVAFENDKKEKEKNLLLLKTQHDNIVASKNRILLYEGHLKDHKEIEAKSKELDRKIKDIRQQKEDVVLHGDASVDGIRITPDGIEVLVDSNWLPFDEKHVAMSRLIYKTAEIILAANKNLPIVLISRGESIDSDRIKWLLDISDKKDAIFLVEKVVDNLNELVCEIIEP